MNSNFDPSDQLSLLKEKCNKISSHLYRVNYLYLEEVRKILPQAIRTSLLSLITDRLGDDFGFSTVLSRKRFQLKIDRLVSDKMSLLTIENLNELARKIDEENIRQLNNTKAEIANALNMKHDSEKSEELNSVDSINISSTPPLENLSIMEGWNGEIKAPYSIGNKETYFKHTLFEKDDFIDSNYKDDESLNKEDKNFDTFNLKVNDLEALQSIFSLTDESNFSGLDSKEDDSSHKTISYEDLKKQPFVARNTNRFI